MTEMTAVEAADALLDRFKSSGWALSTALESRLGPYPDKRWQWLIGDVLSKFVAATTGQNIEFADATVRDDENKIEFLTITSDVLAFLAINRTQTEQGSYSLAPALQLIPRSSLRSIRVTRGVALQSEKWDRESSGVLIDVDYGIEEIKTLPLNEKDVHPSGQWTGTQESTILFADLERLLPGLMRDLNR